jgi:hypothetical protein
VARSGERRRLRLSHRRFPFAHDRKELIMLKPALFGFVAMLCLANTALAQTCPSYTYTLSNGQTADANQVMANFNSILNCANNSLAPLANPHFTGSVGIGTTTPAGSLSVVGQITQLDANANLSNSDANLIFGDWYNGRPNDGTWQQFYWSHTAQSFFLGAATSIAGTLGVQMSSPTYTFQVNGSAAGNTAWTNLSDARLKTNVEEISGALDMVTHLRGVRFQWRQPAKGEIGADLKLPQGTTQIGFIAQEVQSVVPEAVVAPKAGSNGLYGLKEADLVPVLVEAIKEQQAEISKLEADITKLQPAK